ncbi:uncharacterized protein PHALS_10351 [Plasmopara halstedii]|uniref:WLGC domain-containing protein n=1 Tax=Plasmopara halstedii TaxID=4781 RepID=A0A0P1AHZ4_PLAHL|nr:uncharacterized protein PHALS_10351 [Plasmopara halstedii]CEG40134.1 hypothetical protein PHALS_10351 [Plasmopara halstedii]|eukprot:XP_024576503.1 hypothetical protein PHALS_10351 [Plasmopara halstedii]
MSNQNGGLSASPTKEKIASLVCATDHVTDQIRNSHILQPSFTDTSIDAYWTSNKPKVVISESRLPRQSVVSVVAAEVATFFDVFGFLGVPMVFMFILSAAWTFMLAVIQVCADDMANIIMNTTDFDNGKFWLLPRPNDAVIYSSTVLLTVFGAGYLGLAIKMLFFYRANCPPELKTAAKVVEKPKIAAQVLDYPKLSILGQISETWYHFQKRIGWIQLKSDIPVDIIQHYYTAALDLPKLIFQTLTLYTYLEKGFTIGIIYTYSVLLLCNWLVASYRSQCYVADSALVLARLYYTFDLFFAVFAPLVVFVYYIDTFEFDRAAFLTKTETIHAGTFDTVARLFGDPSQISSFCSAFHYLQFTSGSTLFYKSALNLLSLYKWKKIITTLIHNYHERQLEQRLKVVIRPAARPASRTASIRNTVKQLSRTSLRLKHGRHVGIKLFLSISFFCAGSGIFCYSIGAIESTNSLCSKFHKCTVASYQWNFGSDYCTCLVFVDRQIAPKSYAEWTDPEDTTADLAQLAFAGKLRIVQIINRAVPRIPEELRNCEFLEQLILVYTKTTALPEWLSKFSHLEYLHIEGDFAGKTLTEMPDGLFDSMPNLSFLHLGGIPHVQKIPSLSRLKNLRYLTLALIDSLEKFPSFEGLSQLYDLTIVSAPRAAVLPSMKSLVNLKTLKIRPKCAVCCNGFISGVCDMTPISCLPVPYERYPLSCTDSRISDDDKAFLEMFGGYICPNEPVIDRIAMAPTEYTTDKLCGGVKYKECIHNAVQGICYNTRMMVISCETAPGYIDMRKLQIQRGVGDRCDPDVEAWLGCTSLPD